MSKLVILLSNVAPPASFFERSESYGLRRYGGGVSLGRLGSI